METEAKNENFYNGPYISAKSQPTIWAGLFNGGNFFFLPLSATDTTTEHLQLQGMLVLNEKGL